MSTKTVQYASPTNQDTSRGPSNSVWFDCPLGDLTQAGQGGIGTFGMYFDDDFLDFPDHLATNGEASAGKWTAWLGNNAGVLVGTGADTTNLPMEGGVLGLTAGANNNLDITLAGGLSAFRLISPASGNPYGGKLWYEACIAVGSIASGTADLFVGLMDTGDATGTRITSAANLVFSAADTIKTATGNGGCIGFWKRAVTNPSEVTVVYNVNNGTAQISPGTSILTKLSTNSGVGKVLTAMSTTNNIAAANTFIKLGMVFDPTPSCPQLVCSNAITGNQTVGLTYSARVRFFVNGQIVNGFLNSTDVQSTKFPQTFMAPVIGFRSGASAAAAGIGYVDWVRCAQLGSF